MAISSYQQSWSPIINTYMWNIVHIISTVRRSVVMKPGFGGICSLLVHLIRIH
uniref:Alternative protein SPTBN1 n=1 Tax=Homo sapiens TaxID=9606 RepID=L8ECA0_HUMAN|nr:alternative protein SPTBN1 [Homo sapiens]